MIFEIISPKLQKCFVLVLDVLCYELKLSENIARQYFKFLASGGSIAFEETLIDYAKLLAIEKPKDNRKTTLLKIQHSPYSRIILYYMHLFSYREIPALMGVGYHIVTNKAVLPYQRIYDQMLNGLLQGLLRGSHYGYEEVTILC